MQMTLESPATFAGVGLHNGQKVRLTVRPARVDFGVWFRRVDEVNGDRMIPARWDSVAQSRLCSRLENADGVSVSTVEHVMAALEGCGIRNALIDIDGPEVPILDGSAAPFVTTFFRCGIRTLDAPMRAIRILEPVEVCDGEASARIEPAQVLEIDFSIEFEDAAIGSQAMSLSMVNGTFINELCDSRTFCRKADVEFMRSVGLARGGTLRNAVVVDGGTVLNPGGLRYPDEAVRHKMLDVMGDLALAAHPILGRYTGIRAGHALTNRLMRELFARPQAFRLIRCDADTVAALPGSGIGESLPEGLKRAA